MAPKLAMKAKAKAKAKGKGKAKAKAKAKAKTLPEAPAADAPELLDQAAAEGGAEDDQPKPKAKAKGKAGLRKTDPASLTEAFTAAKAKLYTAEATLAEAAAFVQALDEQVREAQAELEKASATVESAISNEVESAARYRDVTQKVQVGATVEELRKNLTEAQKKSALVEVMAVNHKRIRQLEDQRRSLKLKEEEARRRHKEALEATKRALEEAKLRGAQVKAGAKRAAAGQPAAATGTAGRGQQASRRKTAAPHDEQETVPATLVDGEDIE